MILSTQEIAQLTGKEPVEGWTHIAHGSPPVGERVDVMHVLNRSYDCDGELDADGQWQCANGFILPNMMLTFTPTHWRARKTPEQSS